MIHVKKKKKLKIYVFSRFDRAVARTETAFSSLVSVPPIEYDAAALLLDRKDIAAILPLRNELTIRFDFFCRTDDSTFSSYNEEGVIEEEDEEELAELGLQSMTI